MTFTDRELVDAMLMGIFFSEVLARPPQKTVIDVEYIPLAKALGATGPQRLLAAPAHKAIAAYRGVQEAGR